MKKVRMRKTDPSDPKKKGLTKVYIDGIDVSTLPSGYMGSQGKKVAVGDGATVPKKMSSGPKNPGATMKAIKSTKGSAKSSNVKTNYKSTGSNMGKATPMKKRKRGA